MESKSSSEGKDDRDADYFVEELVKFTNTSNYMDKVKEHYSVIPLTYCATSSFGIFYLFLPKVEHFMSDNCAGFETYHQRLASGVGNKLQWMDLFRDYLGQSVSQWLWQGCHVERILTCVFVCVCLSLINFVRACKHSFFLFAAVLAELIDTELGHFCELHDAEPSVVFKLIERYVSEAEDEDFIPLFLKTINEEHFFEQMCACASEATREREILDMVHSEEKGETSMSGIWYFVPESMDQDDLATWLAALGMPWPFKKLFQRAHKKPMKATVRHVPHSVYDMSISIPFFGAVSFSVTLDGEKSAGKDRLGRPLNLFGEESESGEVSVQVRERSGSLMMIFLSMTGPASIRMHREFYSNGVDSGTPGADAVLRCSFRK